ncbi:hypothetical protein B2J88_38745 [Rhodococcus sp. SRB_17]|nr:hypothetical protein [Rhodococcus sp. SRB_17]
MAAGMPAPSAPASVYIGCAGWSLPRPLWPQFGADGTHLQRYATRLRAVEINSSFYRPHQRSTYARWAASVPGDFRFSVKLPRSITHERRLHGCAALLDAFLAQVEGLGGHLGCLLVQLPPSLRFDADTAAAFTALLRARHGGAVALEPRHASWFTPQADALLHAAQISRVQADPVLHAGGSAPGGWPGLRYLRLHGAPQVYYSPYGAPALAAVAAQLQAARAAGAQAWCIFDNTALGHATGHALELQAALGVA